MYSAALVIGLLAGLTWASPPTEIVHGQGITTLSNSQIEAFKPFTFFASAGYCDPLTTLTWTCGISCEANPSFQPIASGGDGAVVQFWYVGYDPIQDTIIVVHQGTDVVRIIPIITDVVLIPSPLDPELYPGISPSIAVHTGFQSSHALAAWDVLTAVKTGLSQFGTKSVTTVGHSLGAALSLLDAVFLHIHIPDARITHYGYGLPRVGNEAFADYVDANIPSFTRITNKKDPVPILPDISLGFHHPSGEAHIDNDLSWKHCPGQDNPDPHCSVGDTPNILLSNLLDHSGPYDGVIMGFCG